MAGSAVAPAGATFGFAAGLLDRHRACLHLAALGAFPPRPPTRTLDHVGLFGLRLFGVVAGFGGRDRFGDRYFP